MKNIMKAFSLALAAVAVLTATSCREEEQVDLAGYGDTKIGFSIEGVEGDVATISLDATYNGEGVLTASGDLTRTYIFTLNTPSPEDVIFDVEPIIVGIPAQYVEIDQTHLVIPAGAKSGSVTVSFTAEDFSFASIEAETYEIGVRVTNYEGYNIQFDGEPEAKVVVEKVPYTSEVSLVIDGTNAQSITFKRSYLDGKIINDDKMTLNFKAVLTRPALTALEIPFSLTGLPAGAEKSASFTGSVLKVAAGEKVSDVLTLNISDDFLLDGKEEPVSYPLQLQAVESANYPSVVLAENGGLNISVNKVLDLMTMVPASDFANLTRITPNQPSTWTGTGNGYGSFGTMFDGVTTGYSDYYYFTYFQVDMKEVKTLNGFKVYCYYSYVSYMPRHFTVDVSEDGNTWMSLGEVEDGQSQGHPCHVLFLKTVKARYLKFTSIQGNPDFVEFELYGPAQ